MGHKQEPATIGGGTHIVDGLRDENLVFFFNGLWDVNLVNGLRDVMLVHLELPEIVKQSDPFILCAVYVQIWGLWKKQPRKLGREVVWLRKGCKAP